MDTRRRALIAGGLFLTVVLGVALDWLIVTDRERIEAFVSCITGTLTEAKIRRALTYTDPAVQPLEVTVLGETTLYGREDASALQRRALGLGRSQEGSVWRALRRTIELQGPAGRVTLQLVSSEGTTDAEFVFHKHGDRWLLGEARFR
ncbi:MAG: hypothetical protein HY909_29915 [Deltaproteobacteria bacterium]|nr:hypothetical protein [Deltaproteobacteria bacterium]